jgi:hypothetical protein
MGDSTVCQLLSILLIRAVASNPLVSRSMPARYNVTAPVDNEAIPNTLTQTVKRTHLLAGANRDVNVSRTEGIAGL